MHGIRTAPEEGQDSTWLIIQPCDHEATWLFQTTQAGRSVEEGTNAFAHLPLNVAGSCSKVATAEDDWSESFVVSEEEAIAMYNNLYSLGLGVGDRKQRLGNSCGQGNREGGRKLSSVRYAGMEFSSSCWDLGYTASVKFKCEWLQALPGSPPRTISGKSARWLWSSWTRC